MIFTVYVDEETAEAMSAIYVDEEV